MRRSLLMRRTLSRTTRRTTPALIAGLAMICSTAARAQVSALTSAPASAVAAAAAGSPSSSGSLAQVLAGLVAVLGLLAVAAWALKRFGVSRLQGGSPVRIVGGISVGTRERVMVLEVAQQWIVVGVTPGGISTLSTMPRQETQLAAEDNGSSASASSSTSSSSTSAPLPGGPFAHWLRNSIARRNEK